MNEEIKELGKQISKILREQNNPYIKVEIDTEGIKITSVDSFEPTEATNEKE